MQRAFVLETIPIGIPRAARACKSARAPGRAGTVCRYAASGASRKAWAMASTLSRAPSVRKYAATCSVVIAHKRRSRFGGAISPRACKYAAPMPSQTPTESRSVPSKSNKTPFCCMFPILPFRSRTAMFAPFSVARFAKGGNCFFSVKESGFLQDSLRYPAKCRVCTFPAASRDFHGFHRVFHRERRIRRAKRPSLCKTRACGRGKKAAKAEPGRAAKGSFFKGCLCKTHRF